VRVMRRRMITLHFEWFGVGSKDNISAMLVKLPGAVLGPEGNGGVDKLREERSKYAAEHPEQRDESPPDTLGSAPILVPGGGNLNADNLVELMTSLVNQRRQQGEGDHEGAKYDEDANEDA
jgi:hypothetical protein